MLFYLSVRWFFDPAQKQPMHKDHWCYNAWWQKNSDRSAKILGKNNLPAPQFWLFRGRCIFQSLCPFDRVIDPLSDGLVCLPAMIFIVIGNTGNDIFLVVEQINFFGFVFVMRIWKADSITSITFRGELNLTHRTCIGAFQCKWSKCCSWHNSRNSFNWNRKNGARDDWLNARLESESMIRYFPISVPYFVSMPRVATIMAGGHHRFFRPFRAQLHSFARILHLHECASEWRKGVGKYTKAVFRAGFWHFGWRQVWVWQYQTK